jgi:putative nucleotidyltransferase with HDIG domain
MNSSLPKTILLVDDDDHLRIMLQDYLRREGFSSREASNASGTMKILQQEKIDLAITDIKMPGKDGLELMQEVHKDYPQIPFIIMTGCAPEYSFEQIVDAGAADFITKPFPLRILQTKINRILYEKKIHQHLQKALIRFENLFEDFLGAIASTLEKRDPYTAGHQRRVGKLAEAIAQEMGVDEEKTNVLRLAAFVHDIGKISVPAEILVKPGKLTEIEMSIIKTHAQAGYDILKNIEFPWPIAEIVLQHHERLDGSGYPRGLVGEECLMEARILGVADAVEAMSSHRPYRPALPLSMALEEVSQKKDILYDANVVNACLRLFNNRLSIENVLS